MKVRHPPSQKRGHEVFEKKLSRAKLAQFVANLPPCLVGMDARVGAHFWAPKLETAGHDVGSMNPELVAATSRPKHDG